ncbi:MAG: NADH-quinone oxidoreductase subunit C [Candidatus Cloacimonetes bacterium]|jgi:NADH-quinone oxidoreductase subunit C|nr:NADH-quinone oxidoreductase subunit C [Candidatus Cloacimonadota bacterium]
MDIEKYMTDIKTKFPKIIETEVVNKKRLMIYIPKDLLLEIGDYLFNELGYRYIIVTAMDSKEGLEIIYHLSDDKSGWVVNLNVMLPRNKPEIESLTPVVYGAEWIEREIYDLLGIKFLNHPKPERFLLAEDWPKGKFPLRREYIEEKN